MDPSHARETLLAQHTNLRRALDRCSKLAHQLRGGAPVRAQLDAALADLRRDFAEHNATETELVRPLLHGSPAWGAVLIDRMLEEHVGEHAAFWDHLARPVDDLAATMDELVEDLEAHMAAEERTFLSPLVLRDDVIRSRRAPPHR
jgi:iron-sulfur cluster repair protein YtfE (RIC family)